jgi:hypothetical protein
MGKQYKKLWKSQQAEQSKAEFPATIEEPRGHEENLQRENWPLALSDPPPPLPGPTVFPDYSRGLRSHPGSARMPDGSIELHPERRRA